METAWNLLSSNFFIFCLESHILNLVYCIAAHSYFDRLSNFPEEILTTLLQDKSFENPKLQALRIFTKIIIEKRGSVLPKEIETFLSAGYSKEQVLELIVGVAHKIMSNYVNHIAETPIDD